MNFCNKMFSFAIMLANAMLHTTYVMVCFGSHFHNPTLSNQIKFSLSSFLKNQIWLVFSKLQIKAYLGVFLLHSDWSVLMHGTRNSYPSLVRLQRRDFGTQWSHKFIIPGGKLANFGFPVKLAVECRLNLCECCMSHIFCY